MQLLTEQKFQTLSNKDLFCFFQSLMTASWEGLGGRVNIWDTPSDKEWR